MAVKEGEGREVSRGHRWARAVFAVARISRIIVAIGRTNPADGADARETSTHDIVSSA